MDADEFASAFGELYREIYRLAARRVDDSRDVLSTETTALLLHLAQTGPLTLTELTSHFGRALSTLSAKVADLEARGLLARQRDDADARRALIWLSPTGRAALMNALDVLDTRALSEAAMRLDAAERRRLLDNLRALIAALPPPQRDKE